MNFSIIRDLRKAAGMTQADLAKKIGINRATLSKYETGQITPPLDQLGLISELLDVSISEMLSPEHRERYEFFEDEAQKLKSFIIQSAESEQERQDAESTPVSKLQYYMLRYEAEQFESIHQAFTKLNAAGRGKAVERVEELTEIPRYQKEPSHPPQGPSLRDSETIPKNGKSLSEGPTGPNKHT